MRHKRDRFVIYFASDLHGSEMCFRKFLNAGPIYGADIVILGGDMAGKAIQGIIATGGDRYECTFRGTRYDVAGDEDLEHLKRIIADFGYYPYVAQPGELEAREQDGTMDELFLELMKERLSRWLQLADERLRPNHLPVYWMLGNDDPSQLDEILTLPPWGVHGDGKIEVLPSGHELLSLGWSNITPWHSYRELEEEDLSDRLEKLASHLERPDSAIFNIHVPPYDTGIDEAPVLDTDLRVRQATGQVVMAPAGSVAVRALIESVQPLLGLHGHIHEASGFRKIGRTLVINPGSDYGSGVLNGVLVTLEGEKVKAHQFVRG